MKKKIIGQLLVVDGKLMLDTIELSPGDWVEILVTDSIGNPMWIDSEIQCYDGEWLATALLGYRLNGLIARSL